ncbi:MAG: glycosyltransferase [Chitinophagales bacterium]|nr:glycosyltransferase [Chitinophagales bacterium]
MKVLFLTAWYPSTQNSSAGLFVKEHVKAIKFSGVDITVLFINVSESHRLYEHYTETFIDENGVLTIQINILSRYWKKVYAITPFLFRLAKKEIKKLEKEKIIFNFLHSNVISPCGIIGYWLSKELEIPHIITEHWTKVDRFFTKNIFLASGLRAYNTAKAVTVVSGYLKRNLIKYISDGSKVHTIPNVIDESIYYYKPKPNDHLKVTFSAIANWAGNKIPSLFIDALEKVQQITERQIVLNIAGTGNKLTEALNKRNLAISVNRLGILSKDEVGDLLRASDFFVHATLFETFSVVVAEALSTGTPVIASNVEPIPDLLQNKQLGYLCENNLEDWINKINKAITTNYNHEYIAGFHKNRFSLKKVGAQFKQLYD